MGKAAKGVVKATVKAVKNAPKTIGKSSVDLGKSLVGANKGNYWENLGESAINSYVVGTTGGMTGTKDLGGTNTLDSNMKDLASPFKKAMDLQAPVEPDMGNPTENAALKEEQENAKKKGRASTVLGGGSDSVGRSSARRSLLGSL